MNINDMKKSRFFSKQDLPAPPNGTDFTILGITEENVALETAAPENKFCLVFAENPKPFVLNQTNAAMISAILGSDETDTWKDSVVQVYFDPTIAMGGKIVGGMRIRPATTATPKTADAAIDNAFDDDVPL